MSTITNRSQALIDHRLRLKRLAEFFHPFESIPFDDVAAEYYGAIRNQLENEGKRIGSNDLMVASIAQARNLVLITKNQSEFLRVAGLRVECW